MTCAAIRPTLSAVAAVALLSAFANGPASAQGVVFDEETVHLSSSGGEGHAGKNARGLATKKPGNTRPLPYIAAPFTGGLSSISAAVTTDTRK